jgi:SagB-type dehydrogenase family enzyme
VTTGFGSDASLLKLPPGSTIRLAHQADDEEWLISHPLEARHIYVNREFLLSVLIQSTNWEHDEGPRGEGAWAKYKLLRTGLEHWWKRGWYPSLDLYLHSQHISFPDLLDATGDIRRKVLREYLLEALPPSPHGVAADQRMIALPVPHKEPRFGRLQALLRRRSRRRFSSSPLPLEALSVILARGSSRVLRRRLLDTTADVLTYLDSFGIWLDVYVISFRCSGLPTGVFFYSIDQHALYPRAIGDYSDVAYQNHMCQEPALTAACALVMVAHWERYQWRYRHERALRNLYIEAGRIAQALIAAAEQYDIGTWLTPAIHETRMSSVLGIDCISHSPVYTVFLGGKA